MAITIISGGVPQRMRVNRGAFGTPLNCPICNPDGKKKSNWEFVQQITPTRIQYRCKNCKQTIQYDFSNNPNFHPYAPYRAPFFTNLVDKWKTKRKQ